MAELTETFTTAAGIVLQLLRPRRFDVLLVDTALLRSEPKPPKKKTETAFGVEEIPDASAPGYQQERNLWLIDRGKRVLDFHLLEYVQVDVPDPLPDDILLSYERMTALGIAPPYDLATADGRKLAYLRRMLDEQDTTRLQLALRRLASPSEEEIRSAEESFPGPVPGAAADG